MTSPEIYVQAKAGAKIFLEAREPLALTIAPEPEVQHAVEHLTKIWRYYSDPSVANDNPDFKGFGEQLWNFNLNRWNAVAFAAGVVDRMTE